MAGEPLLGTSPNSWEYKSLGAVCHQNGAGIQTGPFGSQLHASDYVSAGIPSIMPQNIGDNCINVDRIARVSLDDANRLSRYLVREGDIVYSRRGDVEKRALIRAPEDGWLCGTGCLRVRVDRNVVEPKYASYCLGHPLIREWIVRHAHGATMPNLNTSILSACPFVVPPLPEQRAIANILGTLDDKIELNRRMNETLEAMARALFKDWFVDFGPTRAKIEGRDPYLAPETWDLFPDKLDEDGKPEGWEYGRLADIADSPSRGVRPSEVSKDTPYIGLEHMPRRSVALTEWEGAGKVTSNKYVFKRGEFLFGKLRPYFHKVGIAPIDGICSTDIVVIAPRAPHWNSLTLACISTDDFVDYTNTTSTGTKMPRTSWKTMGQYELCFSTEQVAQAFEGSIGLLTTRIVSNIRECKALSQSRDLLLPKLMSGEIRVGDTDKIVLEST